MIYFCTINGSLTKWIDYIFCTSLKILSGKVNVLVDLNKTEMPTHDARKRGQNAFESEKIGKVALFGMHPVARVLASFVIGVTKKENLRFFKSKDEALAWLKEDK